MENNEKSQKPKEQEAVYTTIVGGRPPGSGTQTGDIPRGIEVLVKKASVDPEFRRLLLDKRSKAAKEIDLELNPSEADMLDAIPCEQLEKIIDNTKVPPDQKPVFLGKVSKLMLATIIAGTTIGFLAFGLSTQFRTAGISPDRVREMQMKSKIDPNDPNKPNDPNSVDSDQNEIEQSKENQEK